MIGASAYSYEGIGIILPIYDVTAKPQVFKKILTFVFITVVSLYIIFGDFCLFVYGDKIDTPLITDNLPHTPIVYVTKVIFACNLFFTYPLAMYPANSIIESYLYKNMPRSTKKTWL